MLFSRKKFNVIFFILSLASGYMQAESCSVQSDADHVSQDKQKMHHARGWSVKAAKEAYSKLQEKTKNAYAFTCQKAYTL